MIVRVRLLLVSMRIVRVISYVVFYTNMIRTLTYSHADCDMYITARNSRVLGVEFASF